jgi:uncharacterized delta-60 repeat protein
LQLKIIFLCILLIFPFLGRAQIWTSRYNGTGDSLDAAYAIAVDNSGNVYVTGRSMAPNYGYDYVTIKYNSGGTQQWVMRYDGPVSSYDEACGIKVDGQGNVYVTGWSYGSGTYHDYATVKYNAAGGQRWAARYNGPDNSDDEAKGLVIDDSGNVYVCGTSYANSTGNDYVTVKYDSLGNERWARRYDGLGSGADEARGIAIDLAGNVYVTGLSYGGSTDVDYATVKYSLAGVQQWVRRYNGPANSTDEAYAIAADTAGNIYVTGVSYGIGTYYDYATVKYDAAGVQQWVARYDGPGSGPDYAYALAVDPAGNACVTGRSYDNGGLDYDYATVKYNAAGAEQWSRRYNGPGDSYDEAYAVAIDISGNVCVTGRSVGLTGGEDYATVKYSPAGAPLWVGRYNGLGNDNDIANAIAVDNAGNIYVTGESYGSGTATDYATLKYSYTVTAEEPLNPTAHRFCFMATITTGTIKIPAGGKLFDALGREAAGDRPPGIYFLQIAGKIRAKIIKLK